MEANFWKAVSLSKLFQENTMRNFNLNPKFAIFLLLAVGGAVFAFPDEVEDTIGVADLDLFPYNVPEDSSFGFGDDDFFQHSFQVPFHFFNATYESVFVSGNGQVSFGEGTRSFTPQCSPSSTPMIMTFWADSREHADTKLFFREATDRALLRKASRDIFKAFPDIRGITVSWLFIVTWKDVAFFGSSDSCGGRSKRNTYQLVLASDGLHSFALMYYNKIQWTTGTASSGNCHGLGGNPAKAGFDFGDGITLYTVEGSCTPSIINITQTSNINQPGKWVFRIDSNLETASCESFDQARQKLRLLPPVIPFMGNVPLKLEGPCLTENSNVSCIFSSSNLKDPVDVTVEGVVTPDLKAVLCNIPYLNRNGRTLVKLRVDNPTRDNYTSLTYSGYIYVVKEELLDQLTFKMKFVEENETVSLTAEWDPDYFQVEEHFVEKLHPRARRSIPESPTVDLILESYTGGQWREVGILERLLENTGSLRSSMSLQRYQNLNGGMTNNDLFAISLRRSPITNERTVSKDGVVEEVSFTDKIKKKMYAGLKEGLVTGAKLKSIIQRHIAKSGRRIGQSLASFYNDKCESWHNSEPPPPTDSGILACPPTLELAERDDNFEPDGAKGNTLEYFHPGAAHSKRQKIPSKISGAGSQCVYDTEGALMVGPPGGGTLDRVSPNGEWLKLGHFEHDVLPYLYCCKWSGENNEANCRNKYYDKRPSDNSTNYSPPRVTRAIGDPHITTFDGLVYTFNGVGEFWMVRYYDVANNLTFKMQARMEQYVSINGERMNASVFTAVAMEEVRNGTNVKIQVSYSDEKIFLLLDNDPVELGDYMNLIQGDFTLQHKSSYITIKSANEVVVTFSSTFSFTFSTVGVNEVALNIIGSAHGSLSNRTEGLMGNFDNVSGNDLKTPDGITYPENTSPESIHYEFGLKWIVKEHDSIFTYPQGRSYTDYYQPGFRPAFITSLDIGNISDEVRQVCGDKADCLFDFLTTGSVSFANETKKSNVVYDQTLEVVSRKVKMCNPPQLNHASEHGYFQMTNLLLGGQLQFECEPGYTLKYKGASGGQSESTKLSCTCVEEGDAMRWLCASGNLSDAKCVEEEIETETEAPVSYACDHPPTLRNGYIIGTNYSVGSSIQLRCNERFDIFWKNCNFNGENGICREPCDVMYTCLAMKVPLGNGKIKVETVWSGYAGDIDQVSCLSRFVARFAVFARATALIIHVGTNGTLVPYGTKPYLIGC